MSPSITLHLRPSPVLLAFWSFGCAVAASVWFPFFPFFPWLAWSPVPPSALVLGGLAVLWYQGMQQLQLRHVAAVTRLLLDGDGHAHWQCRDESRMQGQLAQISVIHPWLTIIALQSGPHRRWLLLAPGSADPETLRRLRVMLLSIAGRGLVTP